MCGQRTSGRHGVLNSGQPEKGPCTGAKVRVRKGFGAGGAAPQPRSSCRGLLCPRDGVQTDAACRICRMKSNGRASWRDAVTSGFSWTAFYRSTALSKRNVSLLLYTQQCISFRIESPNLALSAKSPLRRLGRGRCVLTDKQHLRILIQDDIIHFAAGVDQ